MDRLPQNFLPQPLRALLALLRPQPVLLEVITGKGKWGVRYRTDERPRFCIVLAGQSWIEIRDELPLQLCRGDVLLFNRAQPLRLGNRTADFEMLGGILDMQQANAGLLINLLPRTMHWCEADVGATRLARIMNLTAHECRRQGAVRAAWLARLVKLLLADALRAGRNKHIVSTGLLAGLRDPNIAQALQAMHSDVGHGWLLADLAAVADLSRAGFARRFLQAVGIPPMEYLARWRMSIAIDSLLNYDFSLNSIALKAGFDSARAFSNAFHARLGCGPRTFARGRHDRRRTTRSRRH
jgi:AraC-like DNA-binding protein